MDTPVLISHKTAWLVHHAPRNLVQAVAQRDYQIGVRALSTQQRIARIRQALTDCGIPSTILEVFDPIHPFGSEHEGEGFVGDKDAGRKLVNMVVG